MPHMKISIALKFVLLLACLVSWSYFVWMLYVAVSMAAEFSTGGMNDAIGIFLRVLVLLSWVPGVIALVIAFRGRKAPHLK